MTAIIRTAVHNLIGGVSQQAASVRLDNQAEQATNCYTSVIDGLGKRQPTEHVRRLLEIGAGLDPTVRVHWINRDTTERYAVVIETTLADKQKWVKVFDATTGRSIPVYGNTAKSPVIEAVHKYLKFPNGNLNSPKKNLKLLTIADTTFILNKTVKPAKQLHPALAPTDSYNAGVPRGGKGTFWPDWRTKSGRRAFLFLRTVNASTKYAVRMNVKSGRAFQGGVWPYFWDPPITSFGKISAEEWIRRATAWIKTFNLDFTNHPNHVVGAHFGDTNIRGWGDKDSEPPYEAVNDSSGWETRNLHEGYQVATVNTHEVLKRLWSEWREGTPSHKSTTKRPATTSTYPGGMQDVWYHEREFFDYRWPADCFVGERLAPGHNIIPPILDQVMMVALRQLHHNNSSYNESISITVESQGQDNTLISFTDSIAKLSHLPLTCFPGQVVHITGLEDVDNDDYYVEFMADDGKAPAPGGLVQGSWKESLKSGSYPEILPSTMPMKLVRHPDPGNTKDPYFFVLAPGEWADQTVGDEDSNPDPSFIGQTIEDIFLWRNRLGFLSGSRFIMSEADEYENFWRTTVKSLLDSDPIDIDAGHRRVADLRFAVPLEEDLVIFSDRTQFLAQGDPILTPRTASLSPVTEYESFADVRPEVIGRGIFYPYQAGGGQYSQIDFYHRRSDVSQSFDAFKSTAQIPRYIKGKIVEMTATSTESVLAVRTDDADSGNVIYIHKWLDRGSDRILSSWMKYVIGADTKCRILGMQFIEDVLYLVVERDHSGGGAFNVYIEKIVFSGQRQTDTLGSKDQGFRTFLDRRMSHIDILAAGVAGSYTARAYNAATGTLDVTLPYAISADPAGVGGQRDFKIITGPGNYNGPPGEQLPFTTAFSGSRTVLKIPDPDNALTALWDATKFTFWVGESYTMLYEFSQPTLRERKPEGGLVDIQTGRYQLLRGTLAFEDTGYFKMTIGYVKTLDGLATVDRDDRTHHLPLLEVGLGRTKLGSVNVRDGRMAFGIYSKADQVRLTLENDSPYPCNPKSIEYEAIHARRSKMSRL